MPAAVIWAEPANNNVNLSVSLNGRPLHQETLETKRESVSRLYSSTAPGPDPELQELFDKLEEYVNRVTGK